MWRNEELANAQEDRNGRTPLHVASIYGRADMCEMLLDYGARLDARDNKDRTALHFALHVAVEEREQTWGVINVFMKHPHIIEIVDLKDNAGNSPIDMAIANSDIQSAAKLLSKSKEAEAYFNKVDREQLLIQSLLNGCVNNVERLLEKGTKLPDGDGDGNEERKAAFHLVAMCEEEDKAMKMVDVILEKNPDKDKLVCKSDKRGRTALHEAALSGHKYLCTKLLDINPKLIDLKDRDGRNPLYDAVKAKQNEEEILNILLKAHPEKDTVNILLERGAQPLKERDCDGRTALHYAVQAKTGQDKIKLVKLVLEGCRSDEEKLLLLWASAAGLGTADQNLSNEDAVQNFLKREKSKIQEQRTGNTNLLKIAASMGDMEMTKELISRGYQIADIRDQQWINNLKSQQEENVKMVSRQLERIAEQANDQPTISDNLGRLDYGLAALLLNPYLNPPIVVGISGSWGMGKSSLMAQTESILLKTASQMALLPSSKVSSSALELPEINTFALSKKGLKKYEEIKRQVDNVLSKKEIKKYDENNEKKGNRISFRIIMDYIRSWRTYGEKQESQAENGLAKQDSLCEFLNNYDVKCRKIFKTLAAMDSTDMFTRRPREDQEHQKSQSKTIWDKIKLMWDMFTPYVQHSKTSAQQSKSDSLEEGSVPAILTVTTTRGGV